MAGINCIVIDISPRPREEAAELAAALNGRYLPLPQAQSAAMVAAIESLSACMSRYPDWATDGKDWPNREASRFVRAGGYEWHVQMMGEWTGLPAHPRHRRGHA